MKGSWEKRSVWRFSILLITFLASCLLGSYFSGAVDFSSVAVDSTSIRPPQPIVRHQSIQPAFKIGDKFPDEKYFTAEGDSGTFLTFFDLEPAVLVFAKPGCEACDHVTTLVNTLSQQFCLSQTPLYLLFDLSHLSEINARVDLGGFTPLFVDRKRFLDD